MVIIWFQLWICLQDTVQLYLLYQRTQLTQCLISSQTLKVSQQNWPHGQGFKRVSKGYTTKPPNNNLVGDFNPSEKYQSVGITILNIWKKHVPNHQPAISMESMMKSACSFVPTFLDTACGVFFFQHRFSGFSFSGVQHFFSKLHCTDLETKRQRATAFGMTKPLWYLK